MYKRAYRCRTCFTVAGEVKIPESDSESDDDDDEEEPPKKKKKKETEKEEVGMVVATLSFWFPCSIVIRPTRTALCKFEFRVLLYAPFLYDVSPHVCPWFLLLFALMPNLNRLRSILRCL